MKAANQDWCHLSVLVWSDSCACTDTPICLCCTYPVPCRSSSVEPWKVACDGVIGTAQTRSVSSESNMDSNILLPSHFSTKIWINSVHLYHGCQKSSSKKFGRRNGHCAQHNAIIPACCQGGSTAQWQHSDFELFSCFECAPVEYCR